MQYNSLESCLQVSLPCGFIQTVYAVKPVNSVRGDPDTYFSGKTDQESFHFKVIDPDLKFGKIWFKLLLAVAINNSVKMS